MPADLILRIRAVREAGYVERCHTAGRTSGYSLAQHQYNVAALCHLMWPHEPRLVTHALFHDVPERWTGDVPGQNSDLKRALEQREQLISAALDLPEGRTLTFIERRKLDAADRLELWLWTLEEERRHGTSEFSGFRTLIEHRWREEVGLVPEPVPQVVAWAKQHGWMRLPELFEEALTCLT